jgi:POT family proton-dependent oligopeptide transporter
VGGIIADRTRNYKGTIMVGLIIMAVGYVLMAIPTPTPAPEGTKTMYLVATLIGLFVIAFGNGLFKGNLQALVGQMYDNDKYRDKRDSGFSLFYMFINIGAIFAPLAAIGVRNWWLGTKGFEYNAELPSYCHSMLNGSITEKNTDAFQKLANEVSGTPVADLSTFASEYLNAFTTGFHYAFAVAIIAMGISFVVYMMNKKNFPNPKGTKKGEPASVSKEAMMDVKEVKQRLYALFAVYGIVIFFWFSFHQNGLTLTFFAKNYTLLQVGDWKFSAEIFQSMNPIFVVFLTPLVIWMFARLRNKGKEPSTPKKIAIGMAIAASAYVLMSLGSLGLPLFQSINPEAGGTALENAEKVTPFLLLGTYFILTVAELFISPLGISFVSKVAPPQYQGIMQGGWLGATAVGNQLLFIGAIMYKSIPLWATWGTFVVVCVISMSTMLFMIKWLERIAK